ncbi:MAG: SDR family NAD(P)-dependent oxidoreductase [Spirochaeta sp.]|jgi:short-subunit dehydrogenase|nr:SDR family NAD(P)-dependent oxidoreductase [Spirochaeta sp.]
MCADRRRWALVTGASAGLGRALAYRLARDGYDLLLLARRAERLEEIAADLHAGDALTPRVVAVPIDLTDTDTIIEVITTALAAATIDPGEIALVVNAAGSGAFGPFAEENATAMHRAIRLNIDAPAAIIRWAVPHLQARGGGTICNIASVAAFTPGPLMASYYAAKAWMLALGESLSEEVRGDDVHVVTCCPGPFASEFHEAAGIEGGRLGRLPTADRVAGTVMRSIRRGRVVAPVGAAATLWAVIGPRLPRRWSRRLIGAVQRRRSAPPPARLP